MKYLEIARQMYGVSDEDYLPSNLRSMLTLAEGYANKMGGSIESRQIIALDIAMHEELNDIRNSILMINGDSGDDI